MTMEVVHFALGEGLRLTADVAGPVDGVPVLFLHGGGQTRGAWGNAVKMFAKDGYRAIALDLRGHGDSDWASDGDYTIPTAADDIRAVVGQLGRPVVVIGASFGGMISMIAFGEAPKPPLLSLVLVDITPQINNSGTHRVRSFMMSGADGFASIDEAADAVAAYLPHRPRPANSAGLSRNLRRRENNRYYWHWDPRFIKSFKNTDYAAVEARVTDAVQAIESPILMVRGGASDVVSPAEVETFARLLPHAEIADIPGAHHMVAGDDNSAFATAVMAFVRRTAPVTGSGAGA